MKDLKVPEINGSQRKDQPSFMKKNVEFYYVKMKKMG